MSPFDPITHWTPRRKESLLLAIRHASPTQRTAILSGHGLTEEEVASWDRRFAQHGRRGLHETKTKEMRA